MNSKFVKIFNKVEKLKNVNKNVTVILVDDYSSDNNPTLLKENISLSFII